VQVPVAGLGYRGRSAHGLHYGPAAGGPGVRVGHVTALDARGRSWTGAARHAAGALELRVPAAFLAAAAYPVTIDPTLSPELDLGLLHYVAAEGAQTDPAVGFDGTNFLVAWVDGRWSPMAIYAARLTPAGEVLDHFGFRVSDASTQPDTTPAIACDGNVCLVVWQRSAATPKIFAARLSPAGQVLDATSVQVTPDVQTYEYQTQPAVAKNGTSFLVVWTDVLGAFKQINGGRVGGDGVPLDRTGFLVGGYGNADPTRPAVAANGAAALVAWEDRRAGNVGVDIYGNLVPAGTGTPAPFDTRLSANGGITGATGDQLQPAVGAIPGGAFFAAWKDGRTGLAQIYGTRVTSASGQAQILDGRATWSRGCH
jgi:hypothetical protein